MSGAISPYGDTEAPGDSGTFGDLGRNLWAGTLSLGGSLARAAEYATGHEGFGVVAEEAGKEANYQIGRMSPGGRRAVQAEFLPGGDGPSAYDHGMGGLFSAVAAQAVNSLPSIAASVIPAGMIARGIVAAGGTMAAATAGASGAAGATAGVLSAGSIFGAIADEIGRTPDEQLRESSPAYAAMRSQGQEEHEAKQALIRQGAGLKPLIGGLLSAAAGAMLEGHAVARVATQGRALGAMRGAGIGARAEMGEEAIQSGVEDTGGQLGLADATGRPLDPMQVARAVVQGAVVGGAMGGAMGGAGGLLRPAGQPQPQPQPGRRPAIDPLADIIDPDQRAAATVVGQAGITLAPPQADFSVDARGNASRPGQTAGLLPAPGAAASDIADARSAEHQAVGEQIAGVAPVGAVVATQRANARAAERVGETVAPVSPLVTARAAARGIENPEVNPHPYGLILTPDIVAGILKRNFDATNPLQGVEPLSPVQQAVVTARSNRAPAINEELTPAQGATTIPTEVAPAGPTPAANTPPATGVVPSPATAPLSAAPVVPTARPPAAPPGAAPPQPAPHATAAAVPPLAPKAPAAAPVAGSLEAATAQLPESDRALVAQMPPRVAETFWKASKGDPAAFMEKVRRSRGVKPPVVTAAPAVPPAQPEAPAPAAKPTLTPIQQGARQQLENRLAGVARTAGTKQQFTDAAIESILADLDAELAAAKGGASEIAKQLLPADDAELKKQVRAKVALVEQEEAAKDAATPAVGDVTERKEKTAKSAQKDEAKDAGTERLSKKEIQAAVAGGADALEKVARSMAKLSKDNFIKQAVDLHDAMVAAGQEPWPALKEAVAHKASGGKGGNVEARAARTAEWSRLQAEVAKGAQVVAAPAREAQTEKDTAADRAFDAEVPKTKIDLTPGGLKGRLNRILARLRDDKGRLPLPKKDTIGASPKALWIRAVMDAVANSAGADVLNDLIADEHALRAGDANMMRERRRVDGARESEKRTSIETAGVAATEEGRESGERGHKDFTGEGSFGRPAINEIYQPRGATAKIQISREGKVVVITNTERFSLPGRLLQSASDVLGRMRPRNLGERMLISKLRSQLGDSQVLFVDQEIMGMVSGDEGNLGLYIMPSKNAAKQGSNGLILVAMVQENADETTLHEMTHAATVALLETDHNLRARAEALASAMQETLDNDPLVSQKLRRQFEYYLTNSHEMIAGVFSDPNFQAWMNTHTLDAESYRAVTGQDMPTTPKTFWQVVVDLVRAAMKLPRVAGSTFEAAMSLGFEAFQGQDDASKTFARAKPIDPTKLGQRGERFQDGSDSFARRLDSITDVGSKLLESARPGLKGAGDKLRNAMLGAMTARNIEETYSGKFDWTDKTRAKAKADNPLTQAVQATLQRATTARDHRQKADPVIRTLNALEQKDPAAYAELVSLANDATVAGVHPDVALTDVKNKHVSKTRIGDRQRRGAHAKLAARWAKLTPEAQAAYHQMTKLFESYHAQVSKMLVTNVVELTHFMAAEKARKDGGTVPATPDFAAIAGRFLARKETKDDEAAVGEAGVKQIKEARNLARVKGPYVPQRRFGDFVVQWEEPATATKSFGSEADANAYIDQQTLPISVTVKAFDAAGKEIKSKTNPDPNEPNPTVARSEFTVAVQNKGLAFFDTRGEADAYRAELKRQGVAAVNAVDLREKSEARRTDLLPGQLRELLKSAERNPDLTEAQRNTLINSLEDAALRLLPGSSVKAGWLRRRNVRGASQDLTRVTANYANAAANFMAKLEHAPQIDDAISAMDDNIRETSRDDSKDETVSKRQVLRELQARADLGALDSLGGASANPWIRRMQSFSFVYYLASPAYTAINLMQPWMTGLPWLGARYGAGEAAKAMRDATDVVGGLGVLKAGLRETAQSLREALGKPDEARIDFLGVVLKHIQDSDVSDKRELATMLQRMATEGLIDLTAGMELGRAMDAKKGWVGNKAQAVEDMARAMPAAAEVLNRTMLAVAAYRLELGKGGTPEAAFKAAEAAVAGTQFDYTAANSARFMDPRRHPLLAPAMTFRKFAQGTYFLLVRQAYLAVKGATPEERRIAGRTLAGILASHLLMAGALGLPLEPIRLALGLAAFLFGADEPWDYETEVRQALAEMFGAQAAEVMARGLPRMLGADLSGRVGLDSLLFLKDLRDFKPETLSQYMGEFLVGAPGAALTNAARAPGMIADGDFAGAASAVLPKGLRDIIKAARLADSGVVTRRGERIDGGVPLGIDEAAMQALGIQPARVQETYEQRNAVKGAERRLNTGRAEMLRAYRQAEPGERGEAWARIREWNQWVPREARITFENARSALRESDRRTRESKGETYVPRNRRFLLEEGRFANTRSGQ